MNPLVALLTPQASTGALPPVNAIGAATALAPLGTLQTGSAVNVDSSAFLNLLTAANAEASALPTADIVNSTNTPLSQLAGKLVALQNTGVNAGTNNNVGTSTIAATENADQPLTNEQLAATAIANAKALIQGDASVNKQSATDEQITNTQQSSTASTTASVNIVSNDGRATAQQAAVITKDTPAQKNSTNTSIVRPVTAQDAASTFATVSSNKTGLKSHLTNSNKLLNTFENVNNPQPVANSDVLNTNGTLAGAAKAYAQFDGKPPTTQQPVLQEVANLGNIQSSVELPASVSSSNSEGVTVNNVVSTSESLKALESYQTSAAQTARTHHTPHHTPAEQASIKIANAINSGVKEVTINLHPESLGKIDVKMELSHEGTSKLIVYVERGDTLNALQKDSSILDQVLKDAGYKTDSDSLSFNLRDGSGENLAGSESGQGNNKGNNGEDQVADNDNSNAGIEYRMDLSNGVVDITV